MERFSWQYKAASIKEETERPSKIPDKDHVTKVPRNRGNLERTGAYFACPFHCRVGNQKRKQSINAHQAGSVRQKEQTLLFEAHWRSLYRWKILIILSARGQPALLLTTGGSTEPLFSSNASYALCWDKSYVLLFRKILALTDCFLLDSCYLFNMKDIRKLSRLGRNFKIIFISPLSHFYFNFSMFYHVKNKLEHWCVWICEIYKYV